MPPLIVIVLGALGGVMAWRWIAREASRVNRELDEVRMATSVQPADMSEARTLRADPVSGIYRPD